MLIDEHLKNETILCVASKGKEHLHMQVPCGNGKTHIKVQ